VQVSGNSLSPSRAGDFMTCPLLYRFRVIDRLPQRPTPAATRGTVVHSVLERLFDLPSGERTLATAAAMVEPEWQRLLEAEPELAGLFAVAAVDGGAGGGAAADGGPDELAEWLASAHGLLERYFVLEDPNRLEPAERELRVETVLDAGLTLRGIVDRLDVAPSGEVRVVDYKTGKAPRPGFEARAMFQMRFYALILWRLHGRVPRLLQLLYLGSGEVLRYTPDEADLRATERKLLALWRAIQRATETGDWRPSPSRLCDWCDYQALCPAFGGTPPPIPSPTSGAAPTPAPTGGATDAGTGCDDVVAASGSTGDRVGDHIPTNG
jgi:putative RecB family exonuclease